MQEVTVPRPAGCKHVILFKCTSTYPASPAITTFLAIPHLRKLFACDVALFDHIMAVGVAVASVAIGATAIEMHFTVSRDTG
ncbi:MAG: hypothetical protein DCO99_07535 [Synechococcus sp. XM-24]|nr:MAG: hypothetical protein DCO99_07535 [Synechococcus sp. XM-24]